MHLDVVCGLLSLGWLSCADNNVCARDADAHYAAEGFCVEGIEAFLLGFGKCPVHINQNY